MAKTPAWLKHHSEANAILRVYQKFMYSWCTDTFGLANANSKHERAMRVAEEAIEFAQSLDVSQKEMHTLVNFVYGKPKGEPLKEAGAVLATLSVWAEATQSGSLLDILRHEIERLQTHVDPKTARGKHMIKVRAGLGKASEDE